MEKPNKKQQAKTLDNDVLEMLAEAHEPLPLSLEATNRMRANVMQKIRDKKALDEKKLVVVHGGDDDWIDALPGAKVKILNGDITAPDSLLSYLVKLEPGFKMKGHDHPFDEETLMLEGDLTLGDISLSAGDFHFAAMGSTHGDVSTVKGCVAFMRGALPV